MLSRYSVKKPYTVVVAIVLVLILGAVSLGKMNTDLLPSMELPYAVVITTYTGASPETVETVVTKPVEQSMATVADIENVSSSSSENVSVVILEFQETTNMDSAAIEIREKLDQISGYWDDAVGKPMILKLNPDMMPIMVAAVEIDDMDAADVTDYVENNIQPELESVAGVASVSSAGNITENIEVFIRTDKIEEVNSKVMNVLDKQFADKEEELQDAQEELDSGKEQLKEAEKELEEGKEELDAGKNQMVSGFAQGQQQLNQADEQIESSLSQLEEKEKLLEEKETELTEGIQELETARAQAEEGIGELSQVQTGIENLQAVSEELQTKETELSQSATNLQEMIASINLQLSSLEQDPSDPFYEENRKSLLERQEQAEQQLAMVQQGITEINNQKENTQQQLSSLLSGLGQETPEDAVEYIAQQSSSLWVSIEEIDSSLEKIKDAQEEILKGKEQLETYKLQIENGKNQVSSGEIQMESQKLLAAIDMSVAESQMNSGSAEIEENKTKLSEAQEQLETGKEELNKAKEEAKKQADLNQLVTEDLIKGILAGQNFSMPAGYIQEEDGDCLVRVGDKIKDADSLRNLILLDFGLDGLDPIRLKDVADVSVKDDSDSVYAKLNGNPGIMFTIEKQTGYSTGEVTDRLLERIHELEEEKQNIHFSVLMDQGVYIDLVVDSVVQNMLSGAVLAVLILILFLKSIKPTFVIACSIPISVVTAFVLMYFSGVTLNIISLSGLALGIGMLVDNSIVVIENIDRLRQMGMPAKKAAVEGARQVAGAIAASTLTTICVFAPIVFTEGVTRQLFVDMGLTIAYSLLASLLVALTLVPMMSAGLLKKEKTKQFRILDKIKKVYSNMLSFSLRRKGIVLVLALVLLFGSFYGVIQKGTSFMPSMESTQATMTITAPDGMGFQEMTAEADRIIKNIEDIEDIESIGAMAGSGSIAGLTGQTSESSSIQVYLLLREDKQLTGAELEKEILYRTKDSSCEVEISSQSMDMSALGGSGIQIEIKGRELDELTRISKEIAHLVQETEGTENVSDGQEESDKEFRIVVDKSKAMEYNLTVAQVYQEIQELLAEPAAATVLSASEKDYDAIVREEKKSGISKQDLENMEIEVTDSAGEKEKVKLSEIAEFQEAVGPQTITRDAQSRYMTVSAEIKDGYNIGLVSQEISKKLAEYELPKGYSAEMKGEDETINEAMEQLFLMLILALVFMYLIMVAQFQSLLSPFIIMFTIPLAFTGGFLGLLAADMEISVIAMIGFIMLSGIIVNNGIVLVDYANQLRTEGMEKRTALVQAGQDRLRPIIMTALTTILGLSTMAAGMGMGGDMVQPMAVVTIGGLIYGTLLTLFVVPCIYDLFSRKEYKREDLRLEDSPDETGNER